MSFIDVIKERAKSEKKKIVLPETGDPRTLEAADTVLREGIADIILVGNEEEILSRAEGLDLSKACFVVLTTAKDSIHTLNLCAKPERARDCSRRMQKKSCFLIRCFSERLWCVPEMRTAWLRGQ